jgi:protein-disulfide isomerase-like protein with CxxC motif
VPISATLFSDPGCPWAYSASPALTVLRWRYGDQLQWPLVTIGLSEDASRYVERGYTPARMAVGYRNFRRYGMPFATEPRRRVAATGRACRAIVATRLSDPARELEVYRALQFAWFTSVLVPDDDDDLVEALGRVPGLDAPAIVAAIDSEEVQSAYAADKALTRTAQGTPTEMQGKAAATDGPVRYTAPSLVLERDGVRLEAGGFQPVEAYDVLVANLDPTLTREEPPEDPHAALERFPAGLVTQEVAAIMAHNNQAPDRAAAEDALIALVGEGRARRVALGDDALWLSEPSG